MLATVLTKNLYKNFTGNVMFQAKLDGVRCLYDGVYICTRNSKIITNLHSQIKVHAKLLFDKLAELVCQYNIDNNTDHNFLAIDGELYTDQISFNALNGILNRSKNISTDDEHSMYKIVYHIFDFDSSMPSQDRITILEHIRYEIAEFTDYINIVPTMIDMKIKQADEACDDFISQSYEGVMIRTYDKPYCRGRHVGYLYKHKRMHTDEAIIIDAYEAVDAHKGTLVYKIFNPNTMAVFHCKQKDTLDNLRVIFNEFKKDRNTLINKVYTYSYQLSDQRNRFPIGLSVRVDLTSEYTVVITDDVPDNSSKLDTRVYIKDNTIYLIK